MSKKCAIVLAGGEGKRMKSTRPKVLSEVLFTPMIDWVLDAAANSGVEDVVLVVGHLGEMLESYIADRANIVWQRERLGTGHAVMQALPFLEASDADHVLILNGDAPFMDAETISQSEALHEKEGNAVTVISARLTDPFGYGRIVRGEDGSLDSIVEEKDATAGQRAITEVNSGAMWFNREDLISSLGKLTTDNAAGEYYLTDTIGILRAEGKRAGAAMTENAKVVLGANDRYQLYQLNEMVRKDILKEHMLNGVGIPCMDGIMIAPGVEIAAGTTILPNTILRGKTVIGADCVIGPGVVLTDADVPAGTVLPEE